MKIRAYDSRIDKFVETDTQNGFYPFFVGEPITLRVGDVITYAGLAGKESVAKKHLPAGAKWVPCNFFGVKITGAGQHDGNLYLIEG